MFTVNYHYCSGMQWLIIANAERPQESSPTDDNLFPVGKR
jgi:hypothetical protein